MDEKVEIFSAPFARDLEPVVVALSEAEIPFWCSSDSTDFNPNMAFVRSADQVRVYVDLWDQSRAEQALVEAGLMQPANPTAVVRQMLTALTDEELILLLADPRGTPSEQLAMARTILEERGVTSEPAIVQEQRTAIAAEERKVRQIGVAGKILWLILSFFIPIAGFGASAFILFLSTQDVTGNRYWLFSKVDRFLAVILGLIALAMITYTWYLNAYFAMIIPTWYFF